MERKFTFVPGEYYHIYNRGIEKRSIFQDDKDRVRFQRLLYLCNGENPLVFKTIQGDPLDTKRGKEICSILAYALMPNHFHLLAKENIEGGLSKFLGRLQTAHSMYFNAKYERSGALFCRPFKARHINSDEYFRWVFSYIHLNPLDIIEPKWKEKGLVNMSEAAAFLKNYPFASYPDYVPGGRKENVILNIDALPIDIAEVETVEDMIGVVRSIQGESLES